jgi:predicted RNase H-like HicB family nuclease
MARSPAKTNRKKAPRKKPVQRYVFPVVIERDGDGYYAVCPALQGCYTQGDTYEEALKNIEEVIQLHVEDRLANGEPVPAGEMVSLTTLEVRV